MSVTIIRKRYPLANLIYTESYTLQCYVFTNRIILPFSQTLCKRCLPNTKAVLQGTSYYVGQKGRDDHAGLAFDYCIMVT